MQDGQAGRILEINELLGAAVVRMEAPGPKDVEISLWNQVKMDSWKPDDDVMLLLLAILAQFLQFFPSPYLALDPSCVSPSCLLQDSNMLMHPMGLNYFLNPTPTNPN